MNQFDERNKVRDFLAKVKQTIAAPLVGDEGWVLVRRPENMACILALGYRQRDVRDVILALSVSDYSDGPCRDRGDYPGELWVFGKVLEGNEVYIKLKLACFGSLRIVRVVSFHFAEESLQYPLKDAEEETNEKHGEKGQ